MNTSSRQFAPDFLKAVSIFGVVFIHTYPIFENPLADFFSSLARIAVPIFIILWAYFFEKSYSKSSDRVRYTLKKFAHLFTVFVVWSLIYLALKDTWTMPTVISWLVRHFSGGAWPGQYFFLILLQLIPLFWLLRRLYEFRWCRHASLFLVVFFYFIMGYGSNELPQVISKLSLRPFIYHLPYVFLGMALARGVVPKLNPGWLTIVFLIPLEFSLLKALGRNFDAYLTPSVLLGSAIVTIITIQSFWNESASENLKAGVQTIGQNTLTIFVANPLILLALRRFFQAGEISTGYWFVDTLLAFLLSLIIVAIGLGLARCIRVTRLSGILN